MFREALDYPTRPPRGGRAVLVGGSLLVPVGVLVGIASLDVLFAPLVLVAVVPWLFVRGYYVRVIRSSLGQRYPTPPSFGNPGRLFADGLKALFVAAGYVLPGVVVLGPLAYGRTREADIPTLLFGDAVSGAIADAVLAGVGVLALFALLYLIAAVYAIPVAVANFAYTGRLRSAFEIRLVVSGAASEDYVVAWGISLLLQALILPVAYALKVILVGFYLQFLVAVAVRYCYGQGVGAALGLEPLDSFLELERGLPSAVRPIAHSEVSTLRESSTVSRPSDADAKSGDSPDAGEAFETEDETDGFVFGGDGKE